MSLEGRLKDLGIHEICQLLAQGRKTGMLHLDAPLTGARGALLFHAGALVDASWVGGAAHPSAVTLAEEPRDRGAIEDAALGLLEWSDGDFHFETWTLHDPRFDAGPRFQIPVDPLLMEAHHRAESWAAVRDRVPDATAVATFASADASELPLLRLTALEWELLTRVDGVRDMTTLANLTNRTAVEVATTVHGLIGSGLLAIRPRSPGPATVGAGFEGSPDLWNPDESDTLFDPLADALTERTLAHTCTPRDSGATGETPRSNAMAPPVAPAAAGTSHERVWVAQSDATHERLGWCQMGDAAARRGDFDEALRAWSHALTGVWTESPLPEHVATRVRESIALVTRLHALLKPIR